MIKSLRIRNLATIEDIELNFKEGFSILTGETGAGKSIIIDGLRLVLGEKGSSDMIRTGEREVSVEAIFHPPKDMSSSSDFLPDSETEMFVQRSISEERVGKGYINGILVPIKKMRELSLGLVDIYGQNDHVFLRNPEYQLNYLDYYANASSLRHEVSHNAQELRKQIREKRELESKEREREQRLDFLNYQIKEIEKAIKNSDLSIAPIVDGKLIRLDIPPLSEERRKQLVGQVKHLGEHLGHRVAQIPYF